MSLADIYRANGPVFTVVFLAISSVSIYLVVWRLIKNLRARTDLDAFIENLKQQLKTTGPQQSFEWCRQEAERHHDTIVPWVFLTAFEEGHRGKAAARDAIEDRIETELVPQLQRKLPTILLFAKVSPMVGLLGTVAGMISAFQTIAGASKVNPSELAEDIGMALFTTAEGLIIAIPLIFAYSIFRERVHQFEIELQKGTHAALKLLPLIHGKPRG